MPRISGNAALVDAIYNNIIEGDDVINMNHYLQNNCAATQLDAQLQDGTPSPCFLIDTNANGIFINQRARMMYFACTVTPSVTIILQVGVIVALARSLERRRLGLQGEPEPESWIHDTRGLTPRECSHTCHNGHLGCVNRAHIVIEDKDNNTHRSTRNCFRRMICACGIILGSFCTHAPKCMTVHQAPFCNQCDNHNIDFQPN
jgi:Zinc-binding loop region of homing endonuclease